jgi:hypothetical protein
LIFGGIGGSLAPTSTGVDSALTAEEPGADLLKMLASAAEIGGEVIQVAVLRRSLVCDMVEEYL